jgi:hypothetical protein
MNNEEGVVYLIQPADLVGTDLYEIGCSENTFLERYEKCYKQGTRFISKWKCDDPFAVKDVVRTYFITKFNLIEYKDYFEGNEADIKKAFNDIVVLF